MIEEDVLERPAAEAAEKKARKLRDDTVSLLKRDDADLDKHGKAIKQALRRLIRSVQDRKGGVIPQSLADEKPHYEDFALAVKKAARSAVISNTRLTEGGSITVEAEGSVRLVYYNPDPNREKGQSSITLIIPEEPTRFPNEVGMLVFEYYIKSKVLTYNITGAHGASPSQTTPQEVLGKLKAYVKPQETILPPMTGNIL